MNRATRSSAENRRDRPKRPAARVFARPSDRTKGVVALGTLLLPCALGRAGPRTVKREGDGATPRALLRPMVIHVKRRGAFPLPAGLPVRTIRPSDGWCDDPRSRRYNRPVPLPTAASHERMWRKDGLYDCVIETDWNRRPAVPGRGSAIFIHIARPGFAPTEGCIAFSRKGMKLLLARLRRFGGLRVL